MAHHLATPVLIHELERAKTLVSAHFLSKSAYSVEPIGILLGGQPASGKTGLIRFLQRQHSSKTFIIINGDELRSYHPRYEAIVEYYGLAAPEYTQQFSNALVEWLKAECIRLQYNFIIEGTMRTLNVIEQTAQSLKRAGFICEGHILAVAREDSLLGIFQRYEDDFRKTGLGRFSKIETHDEAYQQIPVNLQTAVQKQWFDQLVIYTRTTDKPLSVNIDGRIFETPISGKLKPFHTLKNGVQEGYSDFETLFKEARQPINDKAFYHQQLQAISELARQRGETNADYLKQIDTFIRQFAD